MITICIVVYLVLGLVMIGSLAIIASRPVPQQPNSQPVHHLQATQSTYEEAESLRRAA